MTEDRRPWTHHRRMEFIEWKLFWEGMLNRSDLEQVFDISTPQASVDLRQYRETVPANIEYSASDKAFLPGAHMVPHFLTVSANRLLLQLRAWLTGALPRQELWFKTLPPVDMAPDIVRNVDPQCLQRILRAIRNRESIGVLYQSLTNSRWRDIAPHALAFDGYRWHVRAWACDRNDFRDFVLSRISEIGDTSPANYDPSDDVEWDTRIALELHPHPGLTPEQSLAIQRDFDMIGGRREIEVRLSMAYYFIRRMNLDLADLAPSRVQICLKNIDAVNAAIEEARAESKRRVGERSDTHYSPG